jgi:hypothetical protein
MGKIGDEDTEKRDYRNTAHKQPSDVIFLPAHLGIIMTITPSDEKRAGRWDKRHIVTYMFTKGKAGTPGH